MFTRTWIVALSAVLGWLSVTETAQAQFLGRGRNGGGISISTPIFSASYGRGGYYSPYSGGYSRYSDYGYRGYSSPYYYSSSYDSSPYYYSSPTYRPVYYTSPSTVWDSGTVVRSSSYSAPAGNDRATIVVSVPARDARVWVQGQPTQQTGMTREFMSPPLEPGKTFTYTVKTAWMENGRERVSEKQVQVVAGRASALSFAGGATEEAESIPPPP